MLINGRGIHSPNLDTYGVQDLLHLDLEIGANVFADKAKCITVSDGGVVVVCMDVIAKNVGGTVVPGYDWRASQRNPYGARVTLNQCFKEAAGRIIVTMGFINEVDPLYVKVVVVL